MCAPLLAIADAPHHRTITLTNGSMTNGPTQTEPTFGFLTILEDADGGALGGLLVVNRRGRPLEFHCTAPVVASRAEEILFGPTLRPFICCERIGATLLAKTTARPSLLVVNQLDSWPIADDTTTPVVLVDPRSTPAADPLDTPTTCSKANLDRLDPAQRPEVERLLGEIERYVDLAEPFERIAEAIREAGLLGTPHDNEPTVDERPHDCAA